MDKNGCTCQCCGITYKTDIIIPDGLWERIKPISSDGLLCPVCIFTKIELLKEFSAYKLVSIK